MRSIFFGVILLLSRRLLLTPPTPRKLVIRRLSSPIDNRYQ